MLENIKHKILEKIIKFLKHPLWDALSNFIKKFKSSKSYWSVSSLILIFTLREAIAWKFGSAIKTFCEEQAKDSDYSTLWDILGFVFDVGGSWELVLLGIFFFVGISVVKVKSVENDEVIKLIDKKSAEQKEEFEEIKALIRGQGEDETLFLQKYFGEDYSKVLENPQTYHNLKSKLLDSSTNIEELLKEKEELLKKIQAQSLKSSIQNMVDQAFVELRYEDARNILNEFIENNKVIGNDLIKAHYQRALAYIEELEYDKAKAVFEEFIPLGIKDAEILYQYGSLYYKLGEYDKVLDCNTKALELNIKEFGKDNAFVAKNYNAIGLAWNSKKEYNKAIEFYNKSLEITLATLGENHLTTATIYNNIGVALESKGEYHKAIEFYTKDLQITLAIVGENHIHTAISYNNIAWAWVADGKYDEGIELYNKSLNIFISIFGDKHPYIAKGYKNIGLAWEKKGEYHKAIEFYNRALIISTPILGEIHPDVKKYKNHLKIVQEKL